MSNTFQLIFVIYGFCGQLMEAQLQNVLQADSDSFPNLEVSLDAPSVPFPQVSKEINKLEAARENIEASGMNKVLRAYRNANADAKERIGGAVGRAMHGFQDSALLRHTIRKHDAFKRSFQDRVQDLHEHGGIDFFAKALDHDSTQKAMYSVNLKATAYATPELEVKQSIDDLEHEQFNAEQIIFQKAVEAMDALTNAVVEHLQANLQMQLATVLENPKPHEGATLFSVALEQSPLQVNVRVVPPKFPFPTIVSLVQAMETRRNLSESLMMGRIMELLVQLLKDENVMIAEALGTAVRHIVAS